MIGNYTGVAIGAPLAGTSIEHFLESALNSSSILTGSLKVDRRFISVMASISEFSGNFDNPGIQSLEGSLSGISVLSGGLTVGFTFSSTLVSNSSLSGQLKRNVSLAGAMRAESEFVGRFMEEFGTITQFDVIKPKPVELQGVYG